jgi:hypothetical protein
MLIEKIKVAFIKFGGLSSGGTERWLQTMAANLPVDQFQVDYFYCDAAPYIGSNYKHADTDPVRLKYMHDHNVNLIKFNVDAKDITKPTHDWVDTDFWQKFIPQKYDLVQAGKAGHAEYPFHLIPLPVVEFVALHAGVDRSTNLSWSFFPSQHLRRLWGRGGASMERTSVVPVPVLQPATLSDFRSELGIPVDAVVAGFHQRDDENIFSHIPLQAFHTIEKANFHFIVWASARYCRQAENLKITNVHFIEKPSSDINISKFLNSLDIFAHGRRDGETFGTVLAEAMMHGLPCLSHASLVGENNAQPETMGPGGFFAQNIDEYIEMLKALFEDKGLRTKLSAKAKAHAEEYYSLSASVEKVGNTYKKLAGRKVGEGDIAIPLEYGYSPLGYLQAGDLENPASIANHVLTGVIPEIFEVNLVRQFLPDVQTFIDIGANVGLYCLVATKNSLPNAKIFAYEPRPDYCAALRKTVWLNNWEEKLTVLQMGIDKIALDNQSDELKFQKVGFIKISVEGFDLNVLEGAEKIILRDRPVLFLGNFHPIDSFNDKQTLDWLISHGYIIWRCVEPGRLIRVKDESQGYLANYFCVHRSVPFLKIMKILIWSNVYFVSTGLAKMRGTFERVLSFRKLKRFIKKVFRRIRSQSFKQEKKVE